MYWLLSWDIFQFMFKCYCGEMICSGVLWCDFYGRKSWFINLFWKCFHNHSELIWGCCCTFCSVSPHPPHVVPSYPFYRAGNWAAGMTFCFLFVRLVLCWVSSSCSPVYLSVHAGVHSLPNARKGTGWSDWEHAKMPICSLWLWSG